MERQRKKSVVISCGIFSSMRERALGNDFVKIGRIIRKFEVIYQINDENS